MLEAKGYAVLPARDPTEAIGIFERDGGEIQLLVTDVVLPQMNGLELARMLRKVSPQLRALFVSGYAHSAAGKSIQEDRLPFLQKPFSVDALLKSVREVLDAPEPG
jgi:DNA-binding NtrC family response regulator